MEPSKPLVATAGESRAACGRLLWCASGGASIIGDPVLDDEQRVYVATSDGYLHAFERDGRFRFSYTVKGTPLGRVSLRKSDGVILLGTTARRIYAINQSGSLHWVHATPTPVWSGLYPLNATAVTFLGLDHRLYALRNTGAALYRVRAPATPTTEPRVGPQDVVWVGMTGAVARFVAAYRLEKIEIPGATDAPVEEMEVVGDFAVARLDQRAYWLDPKGEASLLGEAQALGSDGERFALAHGAEVKILALPTTSQRPEGDPGAASSLPVELETRAWRPLDQDEQVSASLSLHGARVVVPTSSGRLVVLDAKSQECSVAGGGSALRSAVVSESGDFAVTADLGGRFCALELDLARSEIE